MHSSLLTPDASPSSLLTILFSFCHAVTFLNASMLLRTNINACSTVLGGGALNLHSAKRELHCLPYQHSNSQKVLRAAAQGAQCPCPAVTSAYEPCKGNWAGGSCWQWGKLEVCDPPVPSMLLSIGGAIRWSLPSPDPWDPSEISRIGFVETLLLSHKPSRQ